MTISPRTLAPTPGFPPGARILTVLYDENGELCVEAIFPVGTIKQGRTQMDEIAALLLSFLRERVKSRVAQTSRAHADHA